MTPDSWFVLTVAAAFLLLGIAGSPLAWVALSHRRSRLEEQVQKRWLEVSAPHEQARGGAGQLESLGTCESRTGMTALPKVTPLGRFLPHQHANGARQRGPGVDVVGPTSSRP